MDEIVTERSESILRVMLNRPTRRNAMTSSMYLTLADVFDDAAGDQGIRAVLWHGAGDSFCAGNDVEDFLKNPPGPGDSPQARLMHALLDFDKPLIAAVQGAAIGGGTTMLTHCDFVYAGEREVPDAFHQSRSGAGIWIELHGARQDRHIRAAELILLGLPFDARRAAELGLVTQVVSDRNLLATATEIARKLAAKPAGALQAGKRLMKLSSREEIKAAIKAENEEFSAQVRSADAKEALTAFLEKRPPNFTRPTTSATAA